MTFFIFILLLILLILVHELGHFSMAKLFGIRVDEFGIFFPPRIAGIKWGETLYSLNWLPFGGFVKIFGENANEGAADPRSFARASRLTQAAVVAAGIVGNLLFAWLALSVGYMVGMPSSVDHQGFGEVRDARTLIVNVLPDSPAQKAGLMPEDRVQAVTTGTAALPSGADSGQVRAFIAAHQDESIVLTVLRGGEEKSFLARPAAGIIAEHKALGVELDDVGTLRLPPHLALAQGALLTKQMTVSIAEGLGGFLRQIFTGTANFSGVAGPIGIVGLGASAVHEGFAATVILTSLISINLALINLLPVPGLDGGRLLFIAIEAVIRRPISERLSLGLTVAGFALLITLMLVISYHDVIRLVRPA